MNRAYTLATYRVMPGKEQAFIEAWGELAGAISALPNPPYWGTLIRSVADPTLFHSFGPWESADDVAEMRGDSAVAAAFDELRGLCAELTPGDYQLVTHVPVRREPSD